MSTCSGAGKFRRVVAGLGGVWAGGPDDPFSGLYFTQTQSQYQMAYLPAYPEKSGEDSTITFNHVMGAWWYDGPHTERIPHY